jgi:hypothetical protein
MALTSVLMHKQDDVRKPAAMAHLKDVLIVTGNLQNGTNPDLSIAHNHLFYQ